MRRIPLLHSPWFSLSSALIIFALNYLIAALAHSLWGDYLAIAYFGLYGIY